MLPSSVRRVASAAQQSPLISTFTAGATRPIATYTLSSRPIKHQRRCSSSKPSSSDNGPKDLPAGQSVPASTQSAKASGEKRKRKSKSSQASAQKLPSVPSTQHLPLESLALSSFFSQHRPISITHSLPKTISDDAFASIFAPRTKAQKNSEVMSTLSKAVDELEAPFSNLGLGGTQQADAADLGDENVHKIELKHPDGSESSVYVQLNAMSGQFLPFQPPPAPQADNAETGAASDAALTAEAAEEDLDQEHHRVYKAILTIEEQTDANGQVKIVAHSPQLIEEPAPPRTFLERMAVRHLRFEDALRWRERQMEQERSERDQEDGPGMLAISVRRQKKLKMKKKKYKKLMKRTRNLRRKLMK